jgi:hypothetical protein
VTGASETPSALEALSGEAAFEDTGQRYPVPGGIRFRFLVEAVWNFDRRFHR